MNMDTLDQQITTVKMNKRQENHPFPATSNQTNTKFDLTQSWKILWKAEDCKGFAETCERRCDSRVLAIILWSTGPRDPSPDWPVLGDAQMELRTGIFFQSVLYFPPYSSPLLGNGWRSENTRSWSVENVQELAGHVFLGWLCSPQNHSRAYMKRVREREGGKKEASGLVPGQ